ncbi:MAG: hypothetical protein WAW73_20150 [Rhodoferax sp.]
MTTPTAPRFEFTVKQTAILRSVTPHKEFHGEDHKQAITLGFETDQPNTCLDTLFAPGLREALYFNASADSGQVDLEGVDSTLPNLRFSKLNGQRYTFGGKDKLVGYILDLEFGLGDATSNIELELCKVSSRSFETKEGGTVTVFWKVQNASDRLDMDTLGKLVLLGGEEVTMSLRAPAVQMTEKSTEPENPFLNPDPQPLDRDPDEIGDGPLFPQTPEEALAAGVGAE